ncbi:MAG: glucose 1-dehydrogenase [Planctomycetaceae bacterium]|nr:glucose 1-dehydrogenase [Planctomycetaceae bacterium]
MGRLEGRAAIITGGAHGIGRATCQRFIAEGARVIVADIDTEAGGQTVADLRLQGGTADFLPVDLASESSIETMVARAAELCGQLDILVNNAAVFVLRGIDATVEDWQRVLSVNVAGTALVTRAVVPHLRRAGGGAIVNLGSISSFIAQPEFVTYNASKAAIASMTRCLALDLAPDNIRVNAVCPGTVWTRIVEDMARLEGLDRAAADRHPDFGAAHMIPRCADPEEVASAILFLASDDASFITAECLMVDGGYTAK